MNKKVCIYLLSILFTLVVIFASCGNKNDTSSNQKIAYVQPSIVGGSKAKSSSLKSVANSTLASSKANSYVKSGSNLHTTTSISSSGLSSSKKSSSKSSSHIVQSSNKSSSRNSQSSSKSSQSSQTSKVSSALNISVADAITLYKNALNSTLGAQYTSYNFTNKMTGASAINRSGNMIIQNNSNEDIFIKSYLDGNTIYCDGSKLFYKNISSTGITSYISDNYSKKNYYKYINLISSDIDNTEIKAFVGSICADTKTLSFDYTSYSDCSKMSDIFAFESTNFIINKITLNVQIREGLIKNYTQTFDLILDGIQSKCIVDMAFYTVPENDGLIAPTYIKEIN
jgi:hypothetical protein